MNHEIEAFPIWKFIIFGMGVVASITLSATTWIFVKVLDVNDRIVVIESSRCTFQDCNSISAAVSNLKARIDQMPNETPPNWVREKVSSNAERISILEHQQAQLNKNLEALKK